MVNKDYHHNADTKRVINPQVAALFRYYLLINNIQKAKRNKNNPGFGAKIGVAACRVVTELLSPAAHNVRFGMVA